MAYEVGQVRHDQSGKETRKEILFISFNASHHRTTRQDTKLINTHTSKRSHRKQKHENQLFVKASATLQSYLGGFQIGGYRSEPFDILPIECKGFVAEAFDHCEQLGTQRRSEC
jgi:hypothetical protein